MYVTLRSPMISITDLIGPELSELFALERAKIAESDFVYTLASANIDQSLPNLATIYMPIRSRMSSIMGQIKSEHPELLVLGYGKMAESDFRYTLVSTNISQSAPTNINQSAPNLVKIYVTDEFDHGSNRTRTV